MAIGVWITAERLKAAIPDNTMSAEDADKMITHMMESL